VSDYDYSGPSLFGYETDALRRVASISVHTSPLATLGGKDAGGMNVYVRELSCHTASLGVPVDVFTRRTDPDAPEIVSICDGVDLININAGPPRPIDKNQLYEYLPEFVEEMVLFAIRSGRRYDVVHAQYWLSGWAAHLLKRYWDIPFSLMFHTTAHMKNAVALAGGRESPFRERIERQLVQLADSLIAANPDERADLIWRQRTPPAKICTIPPGVDLNMFHPLDRTFSRSQLGLPIESQIVLFVGRIDPIKGIDTLIEAMGLLKVQGVLPTLVVVGGDLDDEGSPVGPLQLVAEQARRLGVADKIRFEGSQPQSKLPLYYSAADVVSVPSRYESFGLVAVEAMACGIPVVASRAGGLRFTIDDGLTGLLTPVGSANDQAVALAKLVSDRTLRLAMGARASQAAERFAWPAVASSVMHVYLQLASGYRSNLCCEEGIFA
jgi:D-inositol-3-phosphate glycosyltransferase